MKRTNEWSITLENEGWGREWAEDFVAAISAAGYAEAIEKAAKKLEDYRDTLTGQDEGGDMESLSLCAHLCIGLVHSLAPATTKEPT